MKFEKHLENPVTLNLEAAEHAKMTKIIDALDAALDAADVRDRLAKKIASLPDPLQAADEVGTATEEGK